MKIGRIFSKVGKVVVKALPTVLVIGGGAGVVLGTISAVKASKNADEAFEPVKEEIDQIKRTKELADNNKSITYTKKTYAKDLSRSYIRFGKEFCRVYGKSALLLGLSLGSIGLGFGIIKRDNKILAATAASLSDTLLRYRNNVKEEFGEEVDKRMLTGVKAKSVDTVVVDENGKEKTEKQNVNVAATPDNDIYSFWLDESCGCYRQDIEYMKKYAKLQERYLNQKLHTTRNGHVVVNDVYSAFDKKATAAGYTVGWIYDPENPVGDNYIEFTLKVCRKNDEFGKSYVLVTMNHDGTIIDKI